MKIKTIVAFSICFLMMAMLILPVVSTVEAKKGKNKPPKPHPNATWIEDLEAWIYPTEEHEILRYKETNTEVDEEPPQELTVQSLPTSSQLKSAISKAKTYINRQVQSYYYAGVYRATSREYPASMICLEDKTVNQWNMPGWDGSTDIITEVSTTKTDELLNYRFIEFETGIVDSPLIWFDRYNGLKDASGYYYMKVQISIREYSGTHTVDVDFQNELLWYDCTQSSVTLNYPPYGTKSYPQTYTLNLYGGMMSFRYTMRHGSQIASNNFKVYGDTTTYTRLDALLDDFGFTYDIYDPLWKMSNSYDDIFMFTNDAYHDIDVYHELPRPPKDIFYPYKSAVGVNRDLYIAQSAYDPLLECIWVIHHLNKYGEPDTAYLYPGTYGISPRDMMRHVESSYWDNNGISYGYEQYTTIRLAVFLVAETLLGYKFGDATSKSIAQRACEVLYQLRASPTDGSFESKDYGVCKRFAHRGGFLTAYTIGTSYAFAVPKRSVLIQWAYDAYKSWFGWTDMPPETKGLVATNSETTNLSLQALRVFLYYHYGIGYPNTSYIP